MRKKDLKKLASVGHPADASVPSNRTASAKALASKDRASGIERKTDDPGVVEIQASIAIKQMDTLDAMNSAAVLLDASGKVVHSNRAFLELIEDGIVLRDQKLTAMDYRSNAKLQRLVREAIRVESDSSPPELRTIVLLRRNRRPLLATLLIVHRRRSCPENNCAILLITDPDDRLRPDEAVLRGAFGLTPSEVRLAQSLAAGESLARAAIRSKVSREAISKQLREILKKTKLHRRSELVPLLLSLRNPLLGRD